MKQNGSGTFLFVGVLLIIFFMFFVLYHILEDDTQYKDFASSIGCTYIGAVKDLPQVKFFDCKGEVKMFKNIAKTNNK